MKLIAIDNGSDLDGVENIIKGRHYTARDHRPTKYETYTYLIEDIGFSGKWCYKTLFMELGEYRNMVLKEL